MELGYLVILLGLIVYIVIGSVIYIAFWLAKNVVITNRKPALALIEQILLIVISLIGLLYHDVLALITSDCWFWSLIMYGSMVTYLILMFYRFCYVYLYLVSTDVNGRITKLCRLFWNVKSIRFNTVIPIFVILVIEFFFLFTNGQCNDYGFIFFMNFVVTLLIALLHYKSWRKKDSIGLNLELGSQSLVFLIIAIGTVVSYFSSASFLFALMLIQMFISATFTLYLPILYAFRHLRLMRHATMKSLDQPRTARTLNDYLNDQVHEISINTYCEENFLFLVDYKLYLENQKTSDVLASLYIGSGAKFELNIYAYMTTPLLDAIKKESDDKAREGMNPVEKEELEKVNAENTATHWALICKEVCNMLNDNVLSQIS